MKRLLVFTVAVLTMATMLTLATTPALAASCAPARVGGEGPPAIELDGQTIDEAGSGGYNCTVQWRALVSLQYQSGGTWHDTTELGPRVHPSSGLFSAGTDHTWTDAGFVPSQPGDTPVCGFNWRFQVIILNTNGNQIASAISQTLHKTC